MVQIHKKFTDGLSAKKKREVLKTSRPDILCEIMLLNYDIVKSHRASAYRDGSRDA